VVGGRNRATNLSPVCLEVSYSKTEEARFFGHLEFIGILSRAIRRARVPVVFSHGFHPKPKLSFSDPLPVGVESECERFWMTVYGPADPEAIRQALNRCLPDGFFLHECRMAASRKDKSSGRTGPAVYNITVNQDLFDAGRVTHGSLEPGPFVITVLDPRNLVLEIRERRQGLSSPGRIVASVFGVDEALIVQGRVVKRAGL
ncbi:MAG: TIGR03936 family radical SAM-associated protein, partial [Thermodesulfobacteriota bacterium]|nr:TIGR03936 family radical SAM-associated protein [Thermodesulfobacteriota bacterium]